MGWRHCGNCETTRSAPDILEIGLPFRTGLKLSTYFSAIKLRWMIDHDEHVKRAHEADDLLFGTVESWLTYVMPFMNVHSHLGLMNFRRI